MSRKYTTHFSNVAATLAQDLFEIQVPSTKCVRLLRVRVSQNTEAGDAQSEQLRFTIKRGVGNNSGSGGSTHTPTKQATGDAASACTVEINNTTRAAAGGGSLTQILEEDENVHLGWDYRPTPDEVLEFAPSETIIIGLEGAPTDSTTMSGYVLFEEVG